MTGLPDVTTLVAYAIVLLTAFSVHEFAHAWTANYFGDDTPRMNGRLDPESAGAPGPHRLVDAYFCRVWLGQAGAGESLRSRAALSCCADVGGAGWAAIQFPHGDCWLPFPFV